MLSVQDLLDRAAIHDVLVRYARSVDRRDPALMAACFTPDAHADYGYFAGDPPTVIDAIRKGVARYASTMHFLGNQLVELAGDRAAVETYAVAYMRRDEGGTTWDLVQGLRYLDDFERRAGEWRIHRRVLKVEWERRDVVVDLVQTVAALARRVARLEDELAIHKLIVRYGLGVDVGDAKAAAGVFTEDGVYDVDVGRMEGRPAVEAMVRTPRHQAMVGHCAHQMGPLVIDLGDDTHAVATGYSRVYLHTPAGTHIYRVSLNRWELEKRDGTWLVARRTTRVLGHDEGPDLFRTFWTSQP